MNRNEIWQEIEKEVRRAKKVHPNWPDHICGQAGIVTRQSGKLMEGALNQKYLKRKDHQEAIIQQAIKTAATAIRFLENLKVK